MNSIIFEAIRFAAIKHDGQKRKYSGEPYLNHLLNVFEIVNSAVDFCYMSQNKTINVFGSNGDRLKVAAILHDVLEDTPTTSQEIANHFDQGIAEYVIGLSDISKKEDGNRDFRKKLDRDHFLKQCVEVHFIKCADLIDNTRDIVKHDKNFAKVYLREKRLLLDGMKPNPLLGHAEDTYREAKNWLEGCKYED